MEFFELETISDFVGEHIRPSFAFMEPRHKDQVFSYQRDHVLTTKLLNPHADRTFYLMKDSNDLGVVRPNYLRTPNDWLCFITVPIPPL
ncbi:MAG: hypothetical protein P4M11_03010 [Candidatus Pacebacteria bacterium]|nr:hypothetical protein [Candidatus Paceibacterota bacterium]